jgi:hypothetical protein
MTSSYVTPATKMTSCVFNTQKREKVMVKMDTWDEMRCPICDTWFYPEKNTRRWCQVCNDKEIEGEGENGN